MQEITLCEDRSRTVQTNLRLNFHELKILKSLRGKYSRKSIKMVKITKFPPVIVFSKRNMSKYVSETSKLSPYKSRSNIPKQCRLMQCGDFILTAGFRGGGRSLYNFFKGRGVGVISKNWGGGRGERTLKVNEKY